MSIGYNEKCIEESANKFFGLEIDKTPKLKEP
jgi:hypothetical protein